MNRRSLHSLSLVGAYLVLLQIPAGLWRLSAAQAVEPLIAVGKESAKKTVLVHYMPWFVSESVRGEWGRHWTGDRRQFNPGRLDEQGLPELASHYHPLIGPYDSSDPAAIECHLLQMKFAGVDGVIVDWYGLAEHDDYRQSHQATQAIFSGTARYGLQFAICFEDRTLKHLVAAGKLDKEQVAEHLSSTFQWLEQNWFSAPHYFCIAGQPLLLNFGPIEVTSADTWQSAFLKLQRRPRFFALNHLWQRVGAVGGFTWVYPEAWAGQPTSEVIAQRLRDEFNSYSDVPSETIVSAFAGFNDSYDNGYPDIAHRDGQTLRETLSACVSGPWPIIQLVTWNDFGEGTMIEPCHEFGYSLLEIVQEFRRNELADLQYSAADLRLPEILYRQRKSSAPQLELVEEAAEQLARGDVNSARVLLQRLSDDSSAEESSRSCVRSPIVEWPSIQLASPRIEETSLLR